MPRGHNDAFIGLGRDATSVQALRIQEALGAKADTLPQTAYDTAMRMSGEDKWLVTGEGITGDSNE